MCWYEKLDFSQAVAAGAPTLSVNISLFFFDVATRFIEFKWIKFLFLSISTIFHSIIYDANWT